MITSKLSVRSALVSMSLVVFGAIGLGACAAPVGTGEEGTTAEEEQVGEAHEAVQLPCCYGTLTCPTTGRQFAWYTGLASCGSIDEKYSTQAQACNNACVAACTNQQQGCSAN